MGRLKNPHEDSLHNMGMCHYCTLLLFIVFCYNKLIIYAVYIIIIICFHYIVVLSISYAGIIIIAVIIKPDILST